MGCDIMTTTSTTAVPPLRRCNTCPAIIVDSTRVERRRRRRNSWSAGAPIGDVTLPAMADRSENGTSSTRRPSSDDEEAQLRKFHALIKGGAMVGVGLVMIPLPIPMGVVVAGAGLNVLGQEFPDVQRFVDNTTGAIKDAWNKHNNKKEKVIEVPEEDNDFSEIDFSSLNESMAVSADEGLVASSSSTSSEESEDDVIFSSKERSELFDSVRRPLQNLVKVWNA